MRIEPSCSGVQRPQRSRIALILLAKLRAGDRIPSARALAAELNVARGTVDTAYSLLAAEGFLVARGRAATFISPPVPQFTRNCAPINNFMPVARSN
jgi:DNA-binding GntR family transcriptional regulator